MPNTVHPPAHSDRTNLRLSTLAQRDKLTLQEIEQKSSAIQDRLWQLKAVRQADTVFTYVHFRSEVATKGFVEKCLQHNINICVPLTITKPPHLVAYQLNDLGQQLRSGYCGIPEPDPGKTNVVSPETIDIIILPGSVFDLHGGRLGYGGGYYDRFLEHDAPNALRIGLAFELQIKNHLPLLAHDQSLHHLVTESRAIDFTKTVKLKIRTSNESNSNFQR